MEAGADSHAQELLPDCQFSLEFSPQSGLAEVELVFPWHEQVAPVIVDVLAQNRLRLDPAYPEIKLVVRAATLGFLNHEGQACTLLDFNVSLRTTSGGVEFELPWYVLDTNIRSTPMLELDEDELVETTENVATEVTETTAGSVPPRREDWEGLGPLKRQR